MAPPKRTEMLKSNKGKPTKHFWECKICETRIEGCSEWRRHQDKCEKEAKAAAAAAVAIAAAAAVDAGGAGARN
ncbi:hypothetical protein FCV25MIE_10074 [Fagus crenata]